MNGPELLEQVAGDVTDRNFLAVGMNLGHFAKTAASFRDRWQGQAVLLHAQHESGLTLIAICEVFLLFGQHPNHTWPASRLYIDAQHTERTLRYPET